MKLSQMFPSRRLDAEDLHAFAPGVSIVTIENVSFRTLEAKKAGDAEIEYSIKFREFRKTVPLSQTRAQVIADVLGTDETDEWHGQTIGIQPVQIQITDRSTKRPKMIWIVTIDIQRPLSPPTLGPNLDITGEATRGRLAAKAMPGLNGRTVGTAGGGGGGGVVMGMDQAAIVVATLRQRGKTWDDFAAHCKLIGIGEAVTGKMPFDAPASVLPVAKAYVINLPKINNTDIQAAASEIKKAWQPPTPAAVIDTSTGEVIEPHDDIPF